jgi:uncharacterized repeat protein (TIGR03803 family)
MKTTLRRYALVALVFLCATACAFSQTTWSESLLYSFDGSNGHNPSLGVIQASDGNFYAAVGGGTHNEGAVVQITPAGVVSTIYNFCSLTNCEDGSSPGALIQGPDGNFYGTTGSGGTATGSGQGVAYKLTPGGVETVLHVFCPTDSLTCADGEGPVSALALGADGNLYGITTSHGVNGTAIQGGTLFQLTTSGTLTTIYSFCAQASCADGNEPYGAPVQGADGNFYGTTVGGGAKRDGVIYQITPAGVLTVLHSFCVVSGCPDAYDTNNQLFEGPNAVFYGDSFQGGAYGAGALYSITAAGAFTTLHSFCAAADNTCADGNGPAGGVILGSDGNLYGTTTSAGADEDGVAFQATTAGSVNTIYNFASVEPDAVEPYGPMLQDSNGGFEGTSMGGGTASEGAVYSLVGSPALAPPVQLSFSPSTVSLTGSTTLSWSVSNAFSDSMQQCYAFVQGGATGAGTWTGVQPGTLVSGIYSGSASITPTAGGAYTYALTCGGVESGFATLTVTGGKTATTTTLADSGSPIASGATEMLTVTVTAAQPTSARRHGIAQPSGTVSLMYEGRVVDTATLSGGSATMSIATTNYAAGSYSLTASYSGDSNFSASTSNSVTVVVQRDATTTTLAASPNPVTEGDTCNLVATVTTSAGTPTGKVNFFFGPNLLGSATVANGTAILVESSAGVGKGTYGITAKYVGDGAHSASTSNTVNVQVD